MFDVFWDASGTVFLSLYLSLENKFESEICFCEKLNPNPCIWNVDDFVNLENSFENETILGVVKNTEVLICFYFPSSLLIHFCRPDLKPCIWDV